MDAVKIYAITLICLDVFFLIKENFSKDKHPDEIWDDIVSLLILIPIWGRIFGWW